MHVTKLEFFYLEHFLCQHFRHVKQNFFGGLKFELVLVAPT